MRMPVSNFEPHRFQADERACAPGESLSLLLTGLQCRTGGGPKVKIDSLENNLGSKSGQPFFS
jgi:hypothetical protein